MKKYIYLFPVLFLSSIAFGQEYARMMEDPSSNFYDIQESFRQFYEGKEYQKGNGWKQFKRWENFMRPRVYPSGTMLAPKNLYKEYETFTRQFNANSDARTANWTPVGPTTMTLGDGGYSPGLGRVNAIAESPSNPNIILVGAPQGGIWRTTNGGNSWTPVTDEFPVSGISDIVFDPNNSNIVYACTGDGDGNDSYGIGVLKSTDGGVNWSTTGMIWDSGLEEVARRIIISHADSDVLYTTTSKGVYKSEDAGDNWYLIRSGSFRDIDMHPTDENKIFIGNDKIYYSTDGGQSFSIATGSTGGSRAELAISPVAPHTVYLVLGQSDGGFRGFYSSADGQNFTLKSDTPNILGSSNDGSSAGGQAWFDLAIECHPTNPNRVLVGGVNMWETTNGGSSFDIITHWSTGTWWLNYVHADIHTLKVFGNTLYSGNDGGIFKSTNFGGDWTDLSDGLQNSQFYEIDVMPSDATKLIAGAQDNGSIRIDNGNGTQVLGGDGMNVQFHRSNPNIWFYEWQYGGVHRTTNAGASNTYIKPDGVEGNWNTPFETSPTNHNTIYIGYENLFKSTNLGDSYTEIETPTSVLIDEIAVFNGDDDHLAITKEGKLYTTTNAGSNWTLSSGLPNLFIKGVVYHPSNPQKMWVVFSGFEEGLKVYYTENGGNNWENISLNLPNVPVNTIIYEPGSNDGLYIGTDMGVFYTNNDLANWISYSEGLPVTVIEDLVYHVGTNSIFSGSYGRGIYKTDAYTPSSSVPNVDFDADRKVVCVGQTVQFEDLSSHHQPGWNWTFAGGTPATSTEMNPQVTWDTPGVYEVSLTVTNGNGSNIKTETSYITVRQDPGSDLPYFEGFEQGTLEEQGFVYFGTTNIDGWQLNNGAGASGVKSAYVQNSQVFPGTNFYLESPTINLEGEIEVYFSYKYAYVRKNGNSLDRLQFWVSKDCGETWSLRQNINASILSTANDDISDWTPVVSEWETSEVTNITDDFYTADFMYRFIFVSNGGNNIYIDDINITNTQGITENKQNQIEIFPNPANDMLNINGLQSGDTEYEIYDLQGKLIVSGQLLNNQIELHQLTKGFYSVRLKDETQFIDKKFVKL